MNEMKKDDDRYRQKPTSISNSDETTKRLMELAGPGSKTAAGIAMHRALESMKPDGERVCYDQYALHFINPAALEPFKDPQRAKAMHEHYERLFPGLGNSIRARVRYFDDFVKISLDEGMEQLVILGAGYDTRAYRIEGLKGRVNVFEVDHPTTQIVKMEKIKKIFGNLPGHVVYVPVDLGTEDLGQRLLETGYDKSKKTLFLMEGLLYYLPPSAVDKILSFIVKNSGKGSSIIFDYYPDSVIDGTCEVGRNIRDFVKQVGEPLLFGINEGAVETFLEERGLSKIRNVTSDDYKRAYFHGANKDRNVCNLLNFAHAVVE